MSKSFSRTLESQLYFIKQKYGFIGLVLQCLSIRQSGGVPTAGVGMNNHTKKLELLINPDYFNRLDERQQIAVLLHEMYHLTHKHVYMMHNYPEEDRRTLNIAMDMVINQLIKDLPNGCAQCPQQPNEPCQNAQCPGRCIKIENFVQADGKPFPVNQTTEYYFEELKKIKDKNEKNGKGKQITDKDGNVWEDSFDAHEWSDADKEEMMKAAKELFQRAKQKAELDHVNIPGDIQDLIRELGDAITKLNHKRLLDEIYKKSIPNRDRSSTWTKKSKRYGVHAPGTKVGTSPRIDTYIDTSGSISIDEFREFLAHNDKFIKFCNKKCELNLFHTELYHTEKYKVGRALDPKIIRSGGTDLQCIIDKIEKTKPDVAVIFTDGAYGPVQQTKLPCEVLFIISENGTENHPLRLLGRTVKMVR